jgi:hypothetical protein
MAMPSPDTDELVKFGYKQELDRSLWLFSSFARGAFTFTGVLSGVGIIYYLARLRGRPAAVLAEHRAEAVLPAAGVVADEPA